MFHLLPSHLSGRCNHLTAKTICSEVASLNLTGFSMIEEIRRRKTPLTFIVPKEATRDSSQTSMIQQKIPHRLEALD